MFASYYLFGVTCIVQNLIAAANANHIQVALSGTTTDVGPRTVSRYTSYVTPSRSHTRTLMVCYLRSAEARLGQTIPGKPSPLHPNRHLPSLRPAKPSQMAAPPSPELPCHLEFPLRNSELN